MIVTKKKELETLLSMLKSVTTPKIKLEQYTTPPQVASEILFLAGFINDDIRGKCVLDLGSGNGCLAIGAKLMGAKEAIGVEIDQDNIRIARENVSRIGLKDINWVNAPIEAILPRFETTIMNPPFGTRNEHADRDFLEKAMEVSDVVYSIHKKSTRQYLIEYIESKEREVFSILQMKLIIPHTYEFHTKRKEIIEVDLFRITKRLPTPKNGQRLKRGRTL